MPDTRKIGGGRKLNSRQLERLEGLAFARGWRAGFAAARTTAARDCFGSSQP